MPCHGFTYAGDIFFPIVLGYKYRRTACDAVKKQCRKKEEQTSKSHGSYGKRAEPADHEGINHSKSGDKQVLVTQSDLQGVSVFCRKASLSVGKGIDYPCRKSFRDIPWFLCSSLWAWLFPSSLEGSRFPLWGALIGRVFPGRTRGVIEGRLFPVPFRIQGPFFQALAKGAFFFYQEIGQGFLPGALGRVIGI